MDSTDNENESDQENEDKEENIEKKEYPFKDIEHKEEVVPLENKYYKDGYVPPVKIINKLAKSLHDLNGNEARPKDSDEK